MIIYADFVPLAERCAPAVHHSTMAALIRVESGFNEFAIGVVKGQLERQPKNKAEAIATAKMLMQFGYNFSVGVGQVNRYNFEKYGLTMDSAFNSCDNMKASSLILKECFDRAKPLFNDEQTALQAAFSCYYSGNFRTGFTEDFQGQPSYVQKILNSSGSHSTAIPLMILNNKKNHSTKSIDASTYETNSALVFQ